MKQTTRKSQGASRPQQPAPDWRSMHRMMLLIRHFEEAVRTLATAGIVPGLVLLCAGQEATNVGVIAALAKGDMVASIIAATAIALPKAQSLSRCLAACRNSWQGNRPLRGRSGSMHFIDLDNGNLGTNVIVGGGSHWRRALHWPPAPAAGAFPDQPV